MRTRKAIPRTNKKVKMTENPKGKKSAKEALGSTKGKSSMKGNKNISKNPKETVATDKKVHQTPTVKEMIKVAITQLKENPKLGSSLPAIKAFIAKEWNVDVKALAARIKKAVHVAVLNGEIIQTKGNGASGRFTIDGLSVKKSRAKLTRKWDNLAPEYTPVKTVREADKEKHEEEKEIRRQEYLQMLQMKDEERANRPKKKIVRKEEWDVQSIKAVKMEGDETFYLVKFAGTKKPQWEPEANMVGCKEMVDEFLENERLKLTEKQELKRQEEEEGKYEVGKLLDVRSKKGKREFLIRWKGHGKESDTWEAEKDLNCKDMMEKFISRWEKRKEVDERELRQNPKRTAKMLFSRSLRDGKRNKGLRVNYEGMDE